MTTSQRSPSAAGSSRPKFRHTAATARSPDRIGAPRLSAWSVVAKAFRSTGGFLPKEFSDYTGEAALCTGIVGGTAILLGSQDDSHRDEDRRFTHLIASAKSDLHYMRSLAQRVRNHFPANFEIARRQFRDQ
ncbi:hypothetical protein ACFWMR_03320 [Amycolatopsis thailandensis]|uniref:hypothetical protein n=1 Tax=Amycolatopsis thailandensis TaxID=589330 RepID=UPI00364ED1A6